MKNINEDDYIKIGTEGFFVAKNLYEEFGGDDFWTAQKADLTVKQQRKFGSKIFELLVAREKLQLQIDEKGAISVLESLLKSKSYCQEDKWQAVIPDLYKKQDAAQLFVPAKNQGMLINAAKSAKVNGGYDPDLIVLCAEDASHYADTIRAIYKMSCYRNGKLEYKDSEGKIVKIWDDSKDQRIPAIMRYNGFGAAQMPIDEVGYIDNNNIMQIDRIIFESSFDGVNVADEYLRLESESQDPYKFGGPVAYYPKTENPDEIKLINEILSVRDEATNLPEKASKMALVLEDTKQMVLLDEALNKGKNRIIMVSFGRYDAVDANIALHRANKEQVPPGPDSMGITNAPAVYQEATMVRFLDKYGIVIVGGMADMVRDDDEQIEKQAQSKVIADKKREAMQGATASWCSSPFQVPYVKQGLEQGRQENEKLNSQNIKTNFTKCIEAQYSVAQIINFPEGIVTEEEIDRFVLKKGLEFFEGYVRGIGCVPIRLSSPAWATMDDFATGGRFQGMFAWMTARHNAKMKCNNGDIKILDNQLYKQKIDNIVADIELSYKDVKAKGKKASAKNFAEAKYKEASELFLDCIMGDVCPTTVKDEYAWPAYLNAHNRQEHAQMHLKRIKQIRLQAKDRLAA